MTVILPEINFLTTNPQQLADELIQLYEDAEGRKLALADPLRIIFLTIASVISKQNVKINDAAKQNLLYYARGDNLDHKGAPWDTPRLEATPAKTTLRIHYTIASNQTRIIPAGTMATSEEAAVFFVSQTDTTVEIGALYTDVELQCTTAGVIGNGFMPGQINALVSQSQIPFVSRVENITESSGGAESEEDESYKERIFLAPEKLTNAGSEGAYKYFAKTASALISDVHVDTPEAGKVHLNILLENGEEPGQEILDLVYEKCSDKTIRPLTDYVTVSAADSVLYDIDIRYYISSTSVNKELIQNGINKAIDDYITWQRTQMKRDINPSRLIADCLAAGAKRVDVISPVYTPVPAGKVAKITNKTVVFGGVEDD